MSNKLNFKCKYCGCTIPMFKDGGIHCSQCEDSDKKKTYKATEARLYMEKNFKDNVLHGLTREYDTNSNITHEYMYQEGELVSEKEFYGNNAIMRETILEAGKAVWVKEYYDTGALMREKILKDGRPIQLNEYYDNGSIMYKRFYENGVLRKSQQYDPQGNLLESQKY